MRIFKLIQQSVDATNQAVKMLSTLQKKGNANAIAMMMIGPVLK